MPAPDAECFQILLETLAKKYPRQLIEREREREKEKEKETFFLRSRNILAEFCQPIFGLDETARACVRSRGDPFDFFGKL
jgi:hypothetical protein